MNKPTKQFSKWIVSLVILLNTSFAAAVLYIFLQIGQEPTILIGAWFAFTTGELWLLSTIKKQENKLNAEEEIECTDEVKEEYYYEHTNSDR